MRQIKFRGMHVDGEWHYGLVANPKSNRTLGSHIDPDGWYICNSMGMPFAYQVRPETVGEFTGLLDSAGNEIYEGDILLHPGKSVGGYKPRPAVVEFKEGGWISYFPIGTTGSRWVVRLETDKYFTIIGNRFEHPELLEAKTND